MSEADFKRAFDAAFFDAWASVAGGIDALYTSPDGSSMPVQVLIDTGIVQFGDDSAPVSAYSTFATLRRAQVEPVAGAAVVVDGATYTLVQRVDSSDESLSKWAVQS